MKFNYFYIILLIHDLNILFSFSSNENKFVKISYSGDNLIPTINVKIKDKEIETLLDNNLHFNYISTKNLNLADINFHYNNDKININTKIYEAYFYIGDISLYDEKNYIHLENFNSFVIDDKNIFSAITVSYLLDQLKEESFINKKIFYLDINNKNCFFGEIPLNSTEYSKLNYLDKFKHATFFSNNTKGVFKQEMNELLIDDCSLIKNELISFCINEYYSTISYTLLNDILKNKIMTKLDCSLTLVDKRGIYGMKCNKNNMEYLPNIYFIFKNNYTFIFPLKLLFDDFDDSYKISIFRTKLKYNDLNEDDKEEENEIIIGYSIIKYFNFSIFSYEERYVTFFSELFISEHPLIFLNKIINPLLYFLMLLLFISLPFLIYTKFKMKYLKCEFNNF